MSKRIYITFSGAAYDESTAKLIEGAHRYAKADEVWVYDDWWLEHTQKEYMARNHWAFEHPHKRGFGWYIWKPYIILDAYNRAKNGDIIIFTDADTYAVKPLDVLFDICKRDGGVMLFRAVGQWQREWCKRDCYKVMGQDEPRYYDVPHGVARFVLVQKGSAKAKQFLEEWYQYTSDQRCNTFDPSVLGPELPGFREHRTEQAIMTNLAHKFGFRLYREASQEGERFTYDKDLFPTLFQQHGRVAGKWLNKTAPVGQGSRYRTIHD